MLIIVEILILVYCQTALGRDAVCKITHEPCGDRCFDPNQHECLGGIKVCAKGQFLCRGQCSDSKECEEHSYQESFNTCPVGQTLCEYQCYDPTHHKCAESGVICTKAQESCGSDCYFPDEQVCLKGIWSEKVVCSIGEEICGEDCYDKNDVSHVCSTEGKIPLRCKAGQKGCAYQCYSPESGAKCYVGVTLCQAGEENCGDECYNPMTETCFNNTQVCRNNREPCGEYMCYWPHNETCFRKDDRSFGYGSMACPKQQFPCGYSCYDPDENVCLIYDRENHAVCPFDSEMCGGKCHSLLDVEKKCVGDILCAQHEDTCGGECYDPKESPGMICQNDMVLCDEGQNGCGNICYDPSTEKCVQLTRRRWQRY